MSMPVSDIAKLSAVNLRTPKDDGVFVEITCSSDKVEKLCSKKCDECKFKLSA